MQGLLLLLIASALPATVNESVFFDFPDDPNAIVLELTESMGFSTFDPDTGKERLVAHHLTIYADGRLRLSKFTRDEPFGHETMQLTSREMDELFIQLFNKGVFEFDPKEVRERELRQNGGLIMHTSNELGRLRINLDFTDRERSNRRQTVKLNIRVGNDFNKAKTLKDDELMKFAEGVQLLRERFFDAPSREKQ